MKPHILFSPEAGTGSGSSEPVKRLAARYNIPEKDVAALLYGSRAPKAEPEGSSIKDTTMPEDFRPNYGAPRERGWSPVTVLSLVVGVLGTLALTIVLIAVLRNGRAREREFDHDMMMRQHMMMPPPMRPPMMHQDSMPTQAKPSQSENAAPEDNTPAPSTQNEMAKPAPKHHTSSSHASGYVTTNSLEAQEHLAEMRAEGNTKARIHESTKNGMTIYTVR